MTAESARTFSHRPFFGRYRTTRILARTEYADIYEAEGDDGHRYAVKVLRLDGVEAALVDALFHREIAALDGFEHDAVVPLRHFQMEADGTPVLVFDLVPGGLTLETLLVRVGEGAAMRPMTWRIAQAQRLVSAVSAAHARHVIHRDLKPANVLVDLDRDCLVICDFGVANVLSLKVMNPGGRTLRDLFTRPYAAPEQCLRGEALSPADVHALSLLIASLLRLALPADSSVAEDFPAFWAPAKEELLSMGAAIDVIEKLGAILQRGLAEKPAERPAISSLAAILESVRAAVTPKPTATLVLTTAVEKKIHELGMSPREVADDLSSGLAIFLDEEKPDPRGKPVPRIKMYGRSLVAVAIWDADDEKRPRLIDLKSPPGPKLANDRRDAQPVGLTIQFGRGDGSALVSAARGTKARVQSERLSKLLNVAQKIIELERARLPAVEVEGVIESSDDGGADEEQGGDKRITEGFRDRVRLKNARVRVHAVRRFPAEHRTPVDNIGGHEPLAVAEIPSLFESRDAMQVCQPETMRQIGKVMDWEALKGGGALAKISFDKEAERPRRFKFVIADALKRSQLDQQEHALDRLRERRSRLAALPELLTLTSAHTLEERSELVPAHAFLNGDRFVRDIIERVLASTVSCIQGPPGTGKTTLIVELVLQLLKKNSRLRILICSQANEAVSNALERLQENAANEFLPSAPWIVRDVRSELRDPRRADGLAPAFHRESGDWIRRATGHLPALPSEAARTAIVEWCRDLENSASGTREDFAAHVQVWGATTSRSERTLKIAQSEDWDVVIVDEAAKATLAEVLVPLVSARRIVLVGDHKQLPPFLDSLTAEQLAQSGLEPDEAKLSLFQQLFSDVLPETHKGAMITQSRMHPTIREVVSTLFYDRTLKDSAHVGDRPLPAGRFNLEHRVLFLNFRGADEQTHEKSRRNSREAEKIVEVLERLDADAARAGQRLTVSVITPYRVQAHDLDERLKQDWKMLEVRAGTVHTFQGRQSDVVIYSLTRTGASEWKFLADPRLFNVALSRARSLLIIVGDLDGASATPILKRLLEQIPGENKISLDSFTAARPSKDNTCATR